MTGLMTDNPFVFGTVVSDENFADRKRELEELTRDLAGKTNLIISSPRRYGKTSLVLKVLRGLRKKGIICAYVDMYPVTSKEEFANVFSTGITKAKAGKINEIIKVIRDLIPPIKLTVRPEGTFDIDARIELELSRGEDDLNANLTKLYDLPEKIAKKKKKKMVVVFDEFQEITKLDEDIERNMRTKIQQHKNVSYVFMGSQRHLLDKMFNDKKSAFFGTGKSLNLGRIPDKEFQIFIQNRFKSGGVTISKDIAILILQLTKCHPYYTQQLCHEVWNHCMAMKSKIVKNIHVSKAKEQVVHNQNYAYTLLWDSAKGRQRSLLYAMAVSDTKEIFSSDFREKYHLGAPSTVARAVEYLEEKGLIEKDGKNYLVSDTFFQEWIQQLV